MAAGCGGLHRAAEHSPLFTGGSGLCQHRPGECDRPRQQRHYLPGDPWPDLWQWHGGCGWQLAIRRFAACRLFGGRRQPGWTDRLHIVGRDDPVLQQLPGRCVFQPLRAERNVVCRPLHGAGLQRFHLGRRHGQCHALWAAGCAPSGWLGRQEADCHRHGWQWLALHQRRRFECVLRRQRRRLAAAHFMDEARRWFAGLRPQCRRQDRPL